MIEFPVDENASLFIIEPGNIRRLKEGKPLKIRMPNGSTALLAYTPDANAFLDKIKVGAKMPEKSGPREIHGGFRLYPEELDRYLTECLSLPEVER